MKVSELYSRLFTISTEKLIRTENNNPVVINDRK